MSEYIDERKKYTKHEGHKPNSLGQNNILYIHRIKELLAIVEHTVDG